MAGTSAGVARRSMIAQGSLASPVAEHRLFRFVPLQGPWGLAPADGRYVVRRHAGEQPDHVLVIGTLGAPRRGLLRGRRESSAAPEPGPTPVATGRGTVIRAEPFEDEGAAAGWLRDADRDHEVTAALGVLNRALHAHRVATADPSA